MKILYSVLLLVAATFCIKAQTAQTSKLTGTIYDANGSVIVGAKVTATAEGKAFSATTNERGVYDLQLSYNEVNHRLEFKSARYDITVESRGFQRSVTKGFIFIPSQFGKMYLDIALEVAHIED